MKKNILLIIMFITLFFTGSNNVFAQLECQVGEENCTKEEINKDISKFQSDSRLVCLYEVEVDNGSKYYNYIFYSSTTDKIYGGTSMGSNFGYQVLAKDDKFNVLGNAYDNLYENNQCPTYSYLNDDSANFLDMRRNKVCFDNNSECKEEDNNFDVTSQSKLIESYSDVLKYKSITYKNSCDKSNLPDEYNDVCRYKDSNGNYLLLLHNNSTNELIYNRTVSGSRVAIPKGQTKQISHQNSKYSTTDKDLYSNKITSSINSCPREIYLNEYEIVEDAHIDVTTYNYAFELTKGEKSTLFKVYSCNDNSTAIETPYENCGDIINGELREIINDIMGIIRIAVPIMLIALITYDLATAVFVGADDKVRKARDKAIKRIIIAIAIFFVPTFVNLVFDLVNDVWGTNYEICGINENNQ